MRGVPNTRETDESYRKGQGVPPFDAVKEITLTRAGDQTVLALEVRRMPLEKIAFFGAGWQIHAENLAAYIAGREPGVAVHARTIHSQGTQPRPDA